MNGLESIFPACHEYGDRIFYDVFAGQYYDRARDLYLAYDELKHFGIPS